MKSDGLRRAIGGISVDMIEAADVTPPRRNRSNIRKIILVAALISLCVISAVGVGIWRAGARKPLPGIPEDTSATVVNSDTDKSDTALDTTADTARIDETDGGKTQSGTAGATTAEPDRAAPDAKGSTLKTGRTTDAKQTTPAASEKRTPEATTGVDDRTPAAPAAPEKKNNKETVKPDTGSPTETAAPTETETETEKPTETDPPDPGPDPEKALFSDVKVTDSSYGSIAYVVRQGYMSGRSEELFEPEEYLTRAEFVQSLYKMADSQAVTGYFTEHKCFYDTEVTAWYYDAVLWSRTNMIINGNFYNPGEDHFYPDEPITRSDVASATLRLLNYLEFELADSRPVADFADLESIPVISRNAVRTLASAGVITVSDGDIFDPDAGITRAQAASLIENLMEKSKIRSRGLLDKYGLTLTYGAQYRQNDPADNSQKIVVSLKRAKGGAIPELKVEGDILGCECGIYGVTFTKKYMDEYADEIFGDLDQFVYSVNRSHDHTSPGCGYFYDGEVLTVTLKISVGGESTTLTLYPKVVSYD